MKETITERFEEGSRALGLCRLINIGVSGHGGLWFFEIQVKKSLKHRWETCRSDSDRKGPSNSYSGHDDLQTKQVNVIDDSELV